jgi:hypothetical protein
MKIHEERPPSPSGGAVAQITQSAKQVEGIDLFLNHLRTELRMRLIPGEPIPRQRTALTRVEAALVAYLSFFYSHDSSQ